MEPARPYSRLPPKATSACQTSPPPRAPIQPDPRQIPAQPAPPQKLRAGLIYLSHLAPSRETQKGGQ